MFVGFQTERFYVRKSLKLISEKNIFECYILQNYCSHETISLRNKPVIPVPDFFHWQHHSDCPQCSKRSGCCGTHLSQGNKLHEWYRYTEHLRV
jgi:hypothetical protein